MSRFMGMAVALLLLATGAAVGVDDDFRKREEADIREAVFRYQMDHLVFAEMWKVRHYYLSWDGTDQDPPADFMKRFNGHTPPVNKVSACTGSKSGNPVQDKKTGESGLVFSVRHIKWISDTAVEVDGWCFSGRLSGWGGTFKVEKQRRGWKVTDTLGISVS